MSHLEPADWLGGLVIGLALLALAADSWATGRHHARALADLAAARCGCTDRGPADVPCPARVCPLRPATHRTDLHGAPTTAPTATAAERPQ